MKNYFNIGIIAVFFSNSTVLLQGAPGTTGQPTPGQTTDVPAPTAYDITVQDGNSRVWQQMTYTQLPDGEIVTNTHSYQELATGLNHLVNGKWVESSENIVILPNGTAAATNSQHQAYFPGDIYQGRIELVTPDDQQLYSRPMELSYFDGTNSVMIAELTNSIGVVSGNNQVIYPNAFTDFKADLVYTYTKAGFEQDIVLREQPPTPESFGLNPNTARLQVLTEFFDPPQPVVQSSAMAPQAGVALTDHSLSFGQMQMIPGKAFTLGTNSPAVRVAKSWQSLEGRQFLVEEVPVEAIASKLATLPLTAMNSGSGKATRLASRHLVLPPQRLAKNDTSKTLMLVRADRPAPGFVLDYQAVNGSVTNFTFQGDTTYLVTSPLILSGTATFEGGTVIKSYSSFCFGMIQIGASGAINCQTAAYRPAIFTSINDNTVGESMAGSGNPYYTGTPNFEDVGGFLTVDCANAVLDNLRFSYSWDTIATGPDNDDMDVWNCQFINTDTCLEVNNVHLHNVLIKQVSDFDTSVSCVSLTAENLTCDGTWPTLTVGPVGELLTNCLLTYTVSGVTYVSTNDVNWATVSEPVFQTVGGGSYYLATNSPYRNFGTTNISPVLLAELSQKTTYPPILYSNVTVSVATTLSPQAQRDTDTPDLGYHYDPIDYLVDYYAITNAILTVTNGAAIASYNDQAGIWLQDGSSIVSIGTPLYPNWFVRYSSVQEQPISLGPLAPSAAMTMYVYDVSGIEPTGVYRFSKFACEAGGGYHIFTGGSSFSYTNLLVQDCEFWSGETGFGGYSNTVATLNNNLFVRSTLSSATSPGSYLFLTNNLFWGVSSVSFKPAGSAGWYALNNDFDSCGNVSSGAAGMVNANNNAYLNSTGQLNPTNATDIFLATALAFQTGPLGSFYQPTNSPLINMGSTTANLVGLYHYTTQTNQVPETNSVVDIGYHYVATDSSGNPLDTLWFGIPDYLADTNGELATWEMNYFGHLGLNPAGDADNDGINNLREYENGSDPNVISFSIEATNDYVNVTNVSVQLNITTGVPYYYAIFVNNTTTTNWLTFISTNLAVNLGITDGVYDVWVGLKGGGSSQQIWSDYSFTLDRVTPLLSITNPIISIGSTTVIKPYLQLQGFANEPLLSLSYDISNAMGVATNQNAFVTDQEFDTNKFDFTTNWFQAYDVPLTNGINYLTVRVGDRAGNVTTTNFTVTLDYTTATTPPVMQLIWPTNSMAVSGTNVTIRGTMSDETGIVIAQVINGDGTTNNITGIVERNNMFWLENVPLNGTNQISIQAVDAAGNVTVTNFTVKPSSLTLTIDSTPTGDALYQASGSVSGTVSDSSATVTVNGSSATVDAEANDAGTYDWNAANAPVNSGGTATFDATANSSGGSSASASSTVEKGAYWAVVYYNCNKQSHTDDIYGNSSSSTWNKLFSADYQAGSGVPSTLDGTVNDYDPSSIGGIAGWVSDVYSWTYTSESAQFTDSIGDADTYDFFDDEFDGITGTPDEDLLWYGDDGTGTPPGWIYHYCAKGVSWHWDFPDGSDLDTAVSAKIRVQLYTGGKAQIQHQNPFDISVAAEAYGQPPGSSINAPWLSTPATPINLTTVTILGEHPDASGMLYTALPDNSKQDFTVTAPAEHYNASAAAVKYIPVITANTNSLDPDSVVDGAQFCVGQNISFDVAGLPPGHIYDILAIWSLPGVFVNTNSDPDCNLFYEKNTTFLSPPQGVSATHCWYVEDGQQLVASVRFYYRRTTNGKVFMEPIAGQFNVHRPMIVDNSHYEDGTPIPMINSSQTFLELGETPHNDMSFKHEINPGNFTGQAGYTQLITAADLVNDPMPFPVIGIALDKSEFTRGQPTISANTGTWVEFYDAPSMGLPSSLASISESVTYANYLMFRPSGGIWVPLRLITWELNDSASYGSTVWTAAGSATFLLDVDSSNFPHWTTTY